MRKELLYVAEDGRDKGKRFKITEMSAMQAERFALKAFSGAVRAGINLPDGIEASGMFALARFGYSMLVTMPYEISGPLFDELAGCIKLMPSMDKPNITRDVIEGDVEEVQTLLKLKKAAYDLHVDFFPDGGQSTSESEASAKPAPTLNIKPRR